MRRTVLVLCACMGLIVSTAAAHVPGCKTARCDHRIGERWAQTHRQWGPLESHQSTVYSGECDGQSNIMADGTQIESDGSLRWHKEVVTTDAIASSFLPLGTKVQFTRPVFGAREWTVRDSGGEFDLYRPNCNYSGWPGLINPKLRYRVLLH